MVGEKRHPYHSWRSGREEEETVGFGAEGALRQSTWQCNENSGVTKRVGKDGRALHISEGGIDGTIGVSMVARSLYKVVLERLTGAQCQNRGRNGNMGSGFVSIGKSTQQNQQEVILWIIYGSELQGKHEKGNCWLREQGLQLSEKATVGRERCSELAYYKRVDEKMGPSMNMGQEHTRLSKDWSFTGREKEIEWAALFVGCAFRGLRKGYLSMQHFSLAEKGKMKAPQPTGSPIRS